jgi:flagellar biosynthesis protein FlhA
LHHLTGILRELLTENVPVSDLKRILEELANLSDKNLSITDSAEILRPALSGLLIQQVAPLNSTLPVITLDAELEQMLITTYRQQNETDLIIDTGLAQQILGEINTVNEKLSSEGRQPVIVVSPFIRRAFSKLVRQNVEDVHVLSFKELPDSRKIEVVASIGNANQETE